MFGLTPMRYSRNQTERTQTSFGGVDRRDGAGDGAIYEMRNMTADRYPLLTTRKTRYQVGTVTTPNGLLIYPGCLAWVDGTSLLVDGEAVAEVTDSRKIMVGIQDMICIWPDKVCYDRGTGLLTQLETSWSGEAAFSDGTYAGETALANTLTVAGDLSGLFREGDGVTVEAEGEAHGAYVVQELEYDTQTGKTELRFHEETWREFVTEATEETESVGQTLQVTIRRTVPELDIVFEHHNRLWGARGSTVYACALGDPTNWQVFDGLTTDSYELVIGSPGEITGGCSYGGRPMFFKEREIIKLYGDYPGQYSTYSWESLGVESGSGGSLVVTGGTLFYKSALGIMIYSDGDSECISGELGTERFRDAVAGSDGIRYYVNMTNSTGSREVWCYDTRYGTWHQEDGRELMAFGWDGELYALEGAANGGLWLMGDTRESDGIREEGLAALVEFGDWTEGTLRRKGPGRLMIRMEVDEDCTVQIRVQYDSSGVWETVRRVEGSMGKGIIEIPLTIRRCDHYRLRLESTGLGFTGWTLHALAWRRYAGSSRV